MLKNLLSFITKRPLVTTLFVALLGAALFGAIVPGTNNQALAENRDCDSNAIMYCGAYSASEFQQKYNANAPGDLRNIYAHYGVNTAEVAGAKHGYVTRDGKVTVNGKVVATGAYTVGRETKPNSHTVTIAGKTYYERNSTSNFNWDLNAFVVLDQFGRFKYALIKDCGNPVVAVPTQPVAVATCDTLTATAVNRTTYNFTAKASASNGGTITGYSYNFGDGTVKSGNATISHTYAKPGTYTVKVTAKTNLGDRTSAACTKTVTVAPEPAAVCNGLTATITNRTNVSLKAIATATNGATIQNYSFTITDENDKTVFNKTATTDTVSTTLKDAGSYKAKVVVKTSVGDKTGPACEKSFTIAKEKVPGVSIEKLVNNKKSDTAAVNVPYDYQLKVTNTGETALTNVKVTDPAPANIQFIKASVGTITNNEWSYTIPSLKVGESVTFTITAQVTKEVEGAIKNTACVDAPTVPGTPDDCDDATVTVPPTPVVPPVTPPELPQTGVADSIVSIIGLGALVMSSIYYVVSRIRA